LQNFCKTKNWVFTQEVQEKAKRKETKKAFFGLTKKFWIKHNDDKPPHFENSKMAKDLTQKLSFLQKK